MKKILFIATLLASWLPFSTAHAANVAKIGTTGYETLEAAVSAATAGQTVEITAAGDYTLPNLPQNITIQGAVEGIVFNHTTAGNIASVSNGATFKNLTFNFGNVNYHGFQHAGLINMDACTLNGKFFSYGDMNFTNCQFVQNNADYHMWVYGKGTVNYTNCTFTNNATGKFLNLYSESSSNVATVTVTGCKFINNSTSANKAAINVKATCGSKILEYTVNVENCTAEGAFPAASSSDALVVLNPLVQVDDRPSDPTTTEKISITAENNTVMNGTEEVAIEDVAYTEGAVVTAAGVAQIGDTKYETLQEAFNAAHDDDVVLLLGDYDATSEAMAGGTRQFVINKSITLDGQGYTITTKGRGFGVGDVNGDMASNTKINVTFKDITIENNASGARCIDTRGKIGSLTLDGVTLKTDGASGITQPLTIGGSQDEIATVNITNSTIQTNEAGTAYYAIVTFNPVNMTIEESTIKGWACIYAKGKDGSAGSAGSTFNIDDCTLVSTNAYSGVSNAFGAFVLEDNDVTINVTKSNITLNNTGDQIQAIVASQNNNVTGSVSLGEGNNVTFEGSGQCAFELNSTNSLEVSGGTFNVEVPEEFCADGYIPEDNGDGTYGVKVGTYVAQIGDTKYETLQEALDAAEAEDTPNIVIDLLNDATLDITAWDGAKNPLSIGTANTLSITINGNGHTLTFNQKNSDWNNVATMNDAQTKLILNDMNITSSGYNNGPWNRHDINFNCAVVLNNVTSDKALAFKNDATLNNVTVNDTGDIYAIWVSPRTEGGQTISINGLDVTCGRGIKIDDEYVSAPVPTTLEIENATFTTSKKSAILVKTAGGADITVGENIDITNVAADKNNIVWVDEDKANEYYNVTVTGANLIPEGGEVHYVASLVRGDQTRGYYATFAAAYNSTDFEDGDTYELLKNTTEAVEVAKALTIVKNGFTAANLTAAEGFKKTETDEAITFVAFNPVCEIAGVQYETLEAAFAAATDGQTITLLADCAGNGIKVPQGKYNTTGLTVDFAGFTYTINGATVGSTGTKTQAFQLLKGNTITFKNGTIVADNVDVKMMIQNYSNLTLESMVLDATKGTNSIGYVVSTNNGSTTISNTTITAKAEGVAFDVCTGWGGYTSNNVEVTGTSKINGDVEVSFYGDGTAPVLTLTSGTLNGDIVMEKGADEATVTQLDTFNAEAPDGYQWKSNGDGTSTLAPNVIVGSTGFATFSSTKALDFTGIENIYAYIAVVENGKVAYKRIRKVPANTGLLLRNPEKTSATAKVPVLASTETAEDTDDNRFVAVSVTIANLATEGDGVTNYILNNGKKGVGFYRANNQKVAAGRAYLTLDNAIHDVKALVFDEDDATGIAEVESFDEGTQATYNLAGQRVPARSAQKGIYIVNGKKIIK